MCGCVTCHMIQEKEEEEEKEEIMSENRQIERKEALQESFQGKTWDCTGCHNKNYCVKTFPILESWN